MELCKTTLCLPGNEHMVVNDSQKTQKAEMDGLPPHMYTHCVNTLKAPVFKNCFL